MWAAAQTVAPRGPQPSRGPQPACSGSSAGEGGNLPLSQHLHEHTSLFYTSWRCAGEAAAAQHAESGKSFDCVGVARVWPLSAVPPVTAPEATVPPALTRSSISIVQGISQLKTTRLSITTARCCYRTQQRGSRPTQGRSRSGAHCPRIQGPGVNVWSDHGSFVERRAAACVTFYLGPAPIAASYSRLCCSRSISKTSGMTMTSMVVPTTHAAPPVPTTNFLAPRTTW